MSFYLGKSLINTPTLPLAHSAPNSNVDLLIANQSMIATIYHHSSLVNDK